MVMAPAVEANLTCGVDTVVVALEIVLAALNVDTGLRLQPFGTAFCRGDLGLTAIDSDGTDGLDGFCRR